MTGSRVRPVLILAIYALSLFWTLPAPGMDGATAMADVTSQAAFARLYAAVRWFHPSDEAAATDWDRLAILGARRVAGVTEREELVRVLREVFLPIAPTVRIQSAPFRAQQEVAGEYTAEGLLKVVWQYEGFDSGQHQAYRKERLNRPVITTGRGQQDSFGTVTQSIDAAGLQGRNIRLRCALRAEVTGVGNQVQAWLRVDRPDQKHGFFDNMHNRPVRQDRWQEVTIEGPVAADATRIFFGVLLNGMGTAWVDDVVLESRLDDGTWQPLPIENGSFHHATPEGLPRGWLAASSGYRYDLVDDAERDGAGVLRIRHHEVSEVISRAFIEPLPEVGEVATLDLGDGLIAVIPLAVHGTPTRTLPEADPAALAQLEAALAELPAQASLADPAVRVAEVVIAWGVFRHFYPYQDVVTIDWDAELEAGLRRALATAADARQQLRNLELLVAALHDGHGYVAPATRDPDLLGVLPLSWGWLEDRLVVTVSDVDAVRPGDSVLTVDGVTADILMRGMMDRVSGSPQWKLLRAGRRLIQGPVGAEVRLELDRAGERFEVMVKRIEAANLPQAARPEPLVEIEPGIWYVDIGRIEWGSIQPRLHDLASARGVVIDQRGYPLGNNYLLLRHLLDHAEVGGRWMQIPALTRPGFEPVSWREHSWNLTPQEPRLGGSVVFLTDARAISYAESILGYVEGHGLGTIVGTPTAGANGNVTSLHLPGGHRIGWTGMRVIKHDGSQMHNIGVLPHVLVEPTVAGLRAGRDEVLEAGLRFAKQGG